MSDTTSEDDERSRLLHKIARQIVAEKHPQVTRTNGELNEDAWFIQNGTYFKNIEKLIDTYCEARETAARIDEVRMWQHHWFKLATNVPRMQASPPQLKVYVADRIAELTALKNNKETK